MDGIKPMVLLVLIVFGLLFLQGLMGVLQYRLIQRKYKEVKGRNKMIAVGRVKRFGRGCIAMLGADDKGRITEGYMLKGLTVFAHFRTIKGVAGIGCGMLQEQLKPSMETDAVMQAVEFLEQGLQNNRGDDQPVREEYIRPQVVANK